MVQKSTIGQKASQHIIEEITRILRCREESGQDNSRLTVLMFEQGLSTDRPTVEVGQERLLHYALGRVGAQKSEKKKKSSRSNGVLGGAPVKLPEEIKCNCGHPDELNDPRRHTSKCPRAVALKRLPADERRRLNSERKE